MGKKDKNKGIPTWRIIVFMIIMTVVLSLCFTVYSLLKDGKPDAIKDAKNTLLSTAIIATVWFMINVPGFRLLPIMIFFNLISLSVAGLTWYLYIELMGDDPNIDNVMNITFYVAWGILGFFIALIAYFFYSWMKKRNEKKSKEEKEEKVEDIELEVIDKIET